MMNNNESPNNFLLGLLVGGLTGGVIGMLFAPKSGKQMRKDLSQAYDEVAGKAQEVFTEAGEKAKDVKEGAKEMVHDLRKRAQNTAAG